jgi:hypothetical protein
VPAVTVHTFRQRHAGTAARPTAAFRWEDDPSEDVAFAAAMEFTQFGAERINMAVDRSGSAPVLRWEDSGTPSSTSIGASGVLWHPAPWNSPSGTTSVAPGPLGEGYWESDQYGRPFDLNDLLA